jgi:Legume lectin domain
MKLGITRLIMVAAIVTLAVIAGSTGAWAQSPPSCPANPNFSPDFSSNQTCMTLNGTGVGFPGFSAPATPQPPVTTVLRVTPNQTDWAGSGWFTAPQPVAGPFSTTFTFQLTGANTYSCYESQSTASCPADGIAFVIQNSGVSALGPEGCGVGFGGSSTGCVPPPGPQVGIPNSLAVEFKTYLDGGDPNANYVAIQNCSPPSANNSVDPGCQIAINSSLLSTMSDGNVHSVTISYTGPVAAPGSPSLDVILDNNDLFPGGGVPVNLSTLLSLTNGTALVGFTASTGGADDNQDIVSWTFTPGAQTAVISTTGTTTLNFPNASGNNVYSFTGQLQTPYATPVIQIQPILMTQSACDAIVQKNFWPARCFVYENAENTGVASSVMFSVTCPTSPGGTCGSASIPNFFAQLGTVFEYEQSENPFFVYPGILGPLNPFPGWLKGFGGIATAPCTLPASGPLFQSNQISNFFIDNATTKGGSSGTGSCWVATYDTPGEIWPGISISSPTFTTYSLNQSVTAKYTCSNPSTSKPVSSATGPYLTVASCTQNPGANSCSTNPTTGAISCTGPVSTSSRGLHLFEVTSLDSGGNQNVDLVIYNVH